MDADCLPSPDYQDASVEAYTPACLQAALGEQGHRRLMLWMVGQTCGVHPRTGELLVYEGDVLTWLDGGSNMDDWRTLRTLDGLDL